MKRDFFKMALLTSTTWKSNRETQMWMHSMYKRDALAYGVNFQGQAVLIVK